MEHEPATARSHWIRRPVLTHVVRAVAIAIPIAAGVAAGWLTGSLLPEADGWAELVWWGTVLALATAAMILADSLARRLLPLSVLLRLTLAFPDRAPSRLRLALRATSVKRMAARVASEDHGELAPAARAVELVALAAALNVHDRRTRGHSQRVQALTGLVAEQLNLTDDERDRVVWAAFLHDIGKLTVPAAILNRPGKPSPAEWKVLRRHPEEGARLAEPLAPWLGDAVGAIGEHHERFDGAGYPRGVRGADISLAGRIVAVTDAFETITAVRSYKKPQDFEHARAEITRCAGTHFDPHVVRALLSVSLGRLRWVVGFASWLALVPLLGAIPKARATMSAPVASGAAGALAGASVATLLLAGSPAPVMPPAPEQAAPAPAPVPGTPGDDTAPRPGPPGPAPNPAAGGGDGSPVTVLGESSAGTDPHTPPATAPTDGSGYGVTLRAGALALQAGTAGAGIEEQDPPTAPSVVVETPGNSLELP